MLLRRYNLNYIPILRELLRTKSVGRTAEIVGLSQSTVSGSLASLRQIFEDELLVMVGRGLQLTEKGAQLLDQVERACAELELLVRPREFDALTEPRRFVVATVDYVAFLLAPRLERILARAAPLASIQFTDLPEDIDAGLNRGEIDVAIFSSQVAAARKVTSASDPFFEDEMVVIASREGKAFSGPLTREIYETSSHVVYRHSVPMAESHENISLQDEGLLQRDRLYLQQFLVLPYVIQGSSSLAVVQRLLAEAFVDSHALEIFSPPFRVPPLALRTYWGKTASRDPALRWLKTILLQACPEPRALQNESPVHA